MTMAAEISPFVFPIALRGRIAGIDQRVSVLDRSLRRYINLDNAASTPLLRNVPDTVNRFSEWYAPVHRSAGFKSRVATQVYEDAREIVAKSAGADLHRHVVIFGKNTTEAIIKLSYRLPLTSEDVVLVSQMEHRSNDLRWRARSRVEHVSIDALGHMDEAHLDRLLQTYAGRIKLVAVTGASNVTGAKPDLRSLAVKVHAAGAQILVDCARLAPHRALDDPAQP